MSADLKTAETTAKAIIRAWELDPVEVSGAILRRCERVDRIVLIVPSTPDDWFGPDHLYERIERFIGEKVRLVYGFGHHFHQARFAFVGASGAEIEVELLRPTPCMSGLAELEGTGPQSFVEAVLSRWRRVMELPDDVPAAAGGWDGRFLCGPDGDSVAVYSEKELFERVGMPYVDPQDRTSFCQEAAA